MCNMMCNNSSIYHLPRERRPEPMTKKQFAVVSAIDSEDLTDILNCKSQRLFADGYAITDVQFQTSPTNGAPTKYSAMIVYERI